MKFLSAIQKFAGHPNIYIFGLVLLAISLPLSKFTTSVSQFIIVGNWLLRPDLKSRLVSLKKNKAILVFLSFLLIYIAGLWHTSNFTYAINDLKTKLPLLLLPLVIGSSQKIEFRKAQIIGVFYILALLVSSGVSAYLFFTRYPQQIYNLRDISIFVPYISLSVQICIGISLLAYFALFQSRYKTILKLVAFVTVLWFASFLFILQSFTGLIIVFTLGLVFFVKAIRLIPGFWLKTSLSILIIGSFVSFAVYTGFEIINNNKVKESVETPKQTTTSKGNRYTHYTENPQMENGYYVHRYICEKELKEAWNLRSDIKYDSTDQAGHKIKYTILRYITSLGLRKDAEGVISVSSVDIQMIQAGYANCIFKKKYSIYPKIYVALKQIENLQEGGSGRGNSVTQRIVAYQIGLDIISKNLLFGVGTGDIENEFENEYKKKYSDFLKYYDSVGVNQFMSTTVALGFTGLIVLLLALFYPIFMLQKQNDYFVWIMMAIFVLYMLSEEIFKFQTPTTLFAYFYSLFIFGMEKK